MKSLTVKQLIQLAKTSKSKSIDQKEICNKDEVTKNTKNINNLMPFNDDLNINNITNPINYKFLDPETKIDNYYIESKINSIFIANEVISKEFESFLIKMINFNSERYIELHGRRVQRWGGTVTKDGLCELEDLPVWSYVIINALMSKAVFKSQYKPNHLLINHYDAEKGILPHNDGPAYYSTVAILSLKNPCIFSFYDKAQNCKAEEAKVNSIYVPERSLLIFKDEAYTKYLHGIDDSEYLELDKKTVNAPLNNQGKIYSGERISITFRHVPLKIV